VGPSLSTCHITAPSRRLPQFVGRGRLNQGGGVRWLGADTTFRDTADGVIEALHGPCDVGHRHVSALDPQDYQFQLRKQALDPRYVLQSRIRACRNLRGRASSDPWP
jgi:hypothetical protein